MIGKSSVTLGKMYINSYVLPGYRIFLTTSITDKPKSFWTFISKLRQDNQGIGDLHVSGSIVSADALKAEALINSTVYNIQKKGVSDCQIWVKVHMEKLTG